MDLGFDMINWMNHPTFYVHPSTAGDYGSVTNFQHQQHHLRADQFHELQPEGHATVAVLPLLKRRNEEARVRRLPCPGLLAFCGNPRRPSGCSQSSARVPGAIRRDGFPDQLPQYPLVHVGQPLDVHAAANGLMFAELGQQRRGFAPGQSINHEGSLASAKNTPAANRPAARSRRCNGSSRSR